MRDYRIFRRRQPNRISATGKGTICNMGAEVGATTSIFAFDDSIGTAYLKLPPAAKKLLNWLIQLLNHLQPDAEVVC
jgi:aconitate hydratase